MRRPGHVFVRAVISGVIGLAGVGLVACSGDDGDAASATTSEPTTTTAPVTAEVALKAGESIVASAGADFALDEPTRQTVVAASQAYVDSAVLAPLVTGAVGPDYDSLFDASVQANAVGPDRGSLTEEGSPTLTETPTVTATPVKVDALADQSGAILLLAATFDLKVDGEVEDGPLRVHRTNELTFGPGPNGTWVITAYRIGVAHDAGTPSPTTTAVAPTTVGAQS